LSKNFTTNGGADCPITSIALFKDKEGLIAYEVDVMSLDDKNVLTVTPTAEGGAYVFYVGATSKGKITTLIKDTINLAAKVADLEATKVFAAAANEKPKFIGLIPEIVVRSVYFEANDTYQDSSIYQYISPVATDKESNQIKISFTGETGKPYLKIKNNYENKPQFALTIDRTLITKES